MYVQYVFGETRGGGAGCVKSIKIWIVFDIYVMFDSDMNCLLKVKFVKRIYDVIICCSIFSLYLSKTW